MNTDERYSRQKDIVPTERITQCQATVIGVGAIGRQVALQLAAIGIPHLSLIDFDHVEESNLASQGYLEADLGKLKVETTAQACQAVNSAIQIQILPERFNRRMEVAGPVFCCVDKIDTRKLIWQSLQERVAFFVDGRMSAEVLRVLTVCDGQSREYYPTTLFAASEAFAGSCTAKTTIYCANIAAGFMLSQFTKYLRQLPIDPDLQLNLLAWELVVG
jgi:molybdopterin/thiamine biosynthesis adenylyltransferase